MKKKKDFYEERTDKLVREIMRHSDFILKTYFGIKHFRTSDKI